MVTDLEPGDGTVAVGFEDVEMVVGVVERVEELAVGGDVERRHGGFVLGRTQERHARTRFLPAFLVPAIEIPDVAERVARAARDVNPLAVGSESEAAPGLLHRERGDLLLGGEIDDVQSVAGVAGVREGEEFAIRADLPAEDHVAGRQLPAGGGRFPAAHQHGVGAVLPGYRHLTARDGVFDTEVVDGAPDAPGQQHENKGIRQAFHVVLLPRVSRATLPHAHDEAVST